MNELMSFQNGEFGQVRTVTIGDKPYFVANDVAKCLGYTTPKDAISRHCKGALKHRHLTSGGEQEIKIIPEGDIYRLIARSKLPSAEKFESWVFDEVLPSIRKHGAYMTPQKIEEVLLNPDTIIQLATNLKDEQEKNKKLENKIEEDKPKVEQFDRYIDSDGTISMNQAAKALQTGRNKLMGFLRYKDVLNEDNSPSSYYTRMGYFTVKTYIYEKSDEDKIQAVTTRVTTKGMDFLYRYLKKHYVEYKLFDNDFVFENTDKEKTA